MKIGQTSLVVFVSKLLGSALGFVATLYFARELGAEVYGLYALVLTVATWLFVGGELGIGKAIKKRLSEAEEQGAYLTASIVWILLFAVVLTIGIVLARPLLEWYFVEFDQYVAFSVVWFVVALLFTKLFYKIAFHTLRGERKVHIAGMLEPVLIGGQSIIQIALVFVGFGLLGMLVGYVIGGIIVGIIGLCWVSTRPTRPHKRHFRSLFDYAKYSWLGGLKGRTFNDIDILILGIFVPTSLVGVYAVAWSLAKFLTLFGRAIRQTLFPEISFKSAQETEQAVAGLIEDSLAYTGLIAIPGFIGGTILADRILRLYGPEFVQGAVVLGLLILAVVVHSYQKQLLNALNAIDRPDIAFRINAVFIALNGGLNVILIQQYGIEGAAIASVLSVLVILVLTYRSLIRILNFTVPVGEISRQMGAATVMGVIVWGGLEANEASNIIENNAIIVISLVMGGATIYFLALLVISPHFRATVDRNLPIELPFVAR